MRRRKLKSFRSADMTWSYKRLRFFGVFRALRAKCQVRGCHLEQKLSSDAQDEKNNKFESMSPKLLKEVNNVFENIDSQMSIP